MVNGLSEKREKIALFERKFKGEINKLLENIQVVPSSDNAYDTYDCLKTQLVANANVQIKTQLGMFTILPRELILVFFDHIPTNYLVKLSVLSKCFNELVLSYTLSGGATLRFTRESKRLLTDEEKMSGKDPFHCLILKSVTITFHSVKRRAYLRQFFHKNKVINDCYGWGRLFISFCGNWHFAECDKLMHDIMEFDNGFLKKLLHRVLTGKVGEFPDCEILVRRHLRGFFLDHEFKDPRDSIFWLSALIGCHDPIARRSRLLMILYGPTKFVNEKETIDWDILSNTTLRNFFESSEKIGPLSLSLSRIMTSECIQFNKYIWSENDLFNLMEDMTTSPEPWTLDNFVALLAHRPALIPVAFINRAIHGHTREIGQLFVQMKTVLYRWNINIYRALMDPLASTMKALPAAYKRTFLASIYESEAELLKELLSNEPFRRWKFMEELASLHSISQLMDALIANI
ncbi:unnamed protein product [Dracunculus medinensis]|uniref:F-box domain-containing protein n=1 Tax=Dracunculus medinensis TaxID=318479 RepID=A0A0N4UP18_DRAME|nr:unnamed protein product [Dracunculus medinensis]